MVLFEVIELKYLTNLFKFWDLIKFLLKYMLWTFSNLICLLKTKIDVRIATSQKPEKIKSACKKYFIYFFGVDEYGTKCFSASFVFHWGRRFWGWGKVNFCRRHPRSCLTIFCIFFNLWRKNMEKSVMRKKMISITKRRAEHPFAGWNIQQPRPGLFIIKLY